MKTSLAILLVLVASSFAVKPSNFIFEDKIMKVINCWITCLNKGCNGVKGMDPITLNFNKEVDHPWIKGHVLIANLFAQGFGNIKINALKGDTTLLPPGYKLDMNQSFPLVEANVKRVELDVLIKKGAFWGLITEDKQFKGAFAFSFKVVEPSCHTKAHVVILGMKVKSFDVEFDVQEISGQLSDTGNKEFEDNVNGFINDKLASYINNNKASISKFVHDIIQKILDKIGHFRMQNEAQALYNHIGYSLPEDIWAIFKYCWP